MKPMIVGVFIALFGIAGVGATALAAPASHELSKPAAHSGHSAQTLPASLRPALYQALSKDAGPAARIGTDGCATLSKQSLKACFDKQGIHFAGTSSPLTLQLVAYGRGNDLSPVTAVRPKIAGNRVSYLHGNLTEWWRVLSMGFEQGFTIAKRPRGHGELTLALTASRQDVRTPHTNTLAWDKLRYGKLVVTDAQGKVVPAEMKARGKRILIAVNDTYAAYPLTVDPLVWLEQKIVAGDGATDDEFGVSVALDGNTALVGAPYATVAGNPAQGAAYVFVETNGVWSETQKLAASDGAAGDVFGISAALDGNIALVGAPGATAGQGAAYAFTETGGTWSETQKLTASDGVSGDVFGISVALDGNAALIGAPYAPVGGNPQQGAAYVFAETDGDWSETQKLTASDGAASDTFGFSVALDGGTALVGASGASVGGNVFQGAAYVFTDTDGSWSEAQKLTANDGAASDVFGISAALDGDTALIGASGASVDGDVNRGAAYVFEYSGGGWNQTQKLIASDGTEYDKFGYPLALDGSTALIGASGTLPGGNTEPNAAYVFTEAGGSWNEARELMASDGTTDDYFANAVALDGNTALIGAPDATIGVNAYQGAVYFYGRSDLGLALSAPQLVGQGETYISQTIATNNASGASPAVSATITVPAAASFVSATVTQGSCSETSEVVICDFGQIEGNAGTATANVTLKALGDPGTTIENTASVAKATPALTASAATEITSPGSCAAGYTEFSGHLDAGGTFTSSPIEVMEAGQKYVDLTAPASFAFFAITTTRYGQHTYVYPHAKHGHRWGAAGTYQVGVQAGPDASGDYTLCVQLNPPD